MRIISGSLRGRRFTLPSGKWPVRPTTDFAKEGLFNTLIHRFDLSEMAILELFGGTGNFSFEFVSRGATDVTYVDNYFPCVQFVKDTSKNWGIEETLHPLKMDAFQFIKKTKKSFDLIVADPPYDHPEIGDIPDLIFQHTLLNDGGWFILEHDQNHSFEGHQNFRQVKNYGKTFFSFFER